MKFLDALIRQLASILNIPRPNPGANDSGLSSAGGPAQPALAAAESGTATIADRPAPNPPALLADGSPVELGQPVVFTHGAPNGRGWTAGTLVGCDVDGAPARCRLAIALLRPNCCLTSHYCWGIIVNVDPGKCSRPIQL
jgi:hypothetical protein